MRMGPKGGVVCGRRKIRLHKRQHREGGLLESVFSILCKSNKAKSRWVRTHRRYQSSQ